MNINKHLCINNDSFNLRLDFELEDFKINFLMKNPKECDWASLFQKNGKIKIPIDGDFIVTFSRDELVLNITLGKKDVLISYTVIYRDIEKELQDLDKWFKSYIN